MQSKGRLSKWISAEFPHIQFYNELLFLPWWGLNPVKEQAGHTWVFTLISGTQRCSGIQPLPSKCTRRIICGKSCLTESSTRFEALSPLFSCNGFLLKMYIILLWINEVTAAFTHFPFPQTLMDDWHSPQFSQSFPSLSYPCRGGNPGQSHRTHRKSNFAKLNINVSNAPLLPLLFR